MQIILVKLTLYLTEKCRNRTNSPFHFLAKSPKVKKKIPKKNQTILIPYMLQAQPALVPQLLACYCGSTPPCTGNGNCITPIHNEQADHSLQFVRMGCPKTLGLNGRSSYLHNSHKFHQEQYLDLVSANKNRVAVYRETLI